MSDLGCPDCKGTCGGKNMNGFAEEGYYTRSIRNQHRAIIPAPGSCCGLTMGETGNGMRSDVGQVGSRPMGAAMVTPAQGKRARMLARRKMLSETEKAFFGGRERGFAGDDLDGGLSGDGDWTPAFKADWTNKAKMAEAMPAGQARDFAVPLLQAFRGIAPGWSDSSWGVFGPAYDTYQNIVKKLIAAQQKGLAASGTIAASAFQKGDTSVYGNFDSGDVKKSAKDLLGGAKDAAQGIFSFGSFGVGSTVVLLGVGYYLLNRPRRRSNPRRGRKG